MADIYMLMDIIFEIFHLLSASIILNLTKDEKSQFSSLQILHKIHAKAHGRRKQGTKGFPHLQ